MTDTAALYARLDTAFGQHDWLLVQQLSAHLLSMRPDHAGVHYMAGVAAMELQQMPSALGHLQRAHALAPENAAFATHYARGLALLRRYHAARIAADSALALAPSDPQLLDTLGVTFSLMGAYNEALTAFRKAVALAPKRASFRYNFSAALMAAGDIHGAESEMECCIALDPRHWQAHLSLSQLRRQTPDSNHVERLTSLLSAIHDDVGTDQIAEVPLNMALAKEYEDLGNYASAFDSLVRGKKAAATHRSYSIQRDEVLFASITDAVSKSPAGVSGYPTQEPIFVIGMPRTGTTLVERILSSHPDVHSAGELMNFPMAFKFLSGSPDPLPLIDPQTIAMSRHMDWARLGETYLASTRPITGSKPRFVDKLPQNFLYAGFIANALPNARIICLRRDPMDTCLSNFRQLFVADSPYFDYSLNLLDTGRYFVLFDRLMAHWRHVFPGRILEIDYEALVAGQEATSRQLLEFCDLPWNDACLRFEENPAPVATASAVQVRESLYGRARGRWKKYEAQLGELRNLLSDAGIRLDQA